MARRLQSQRACLPSPAEVACWARASLFPDRAVARRILPQLRRARGGQMHLDDVSWHGGRGRSEPPAIRRRGQSSSASAMRTGRVRPDARALSVSPGGAHATAAVTMISTRIAGDASMASVVARAGAVPSGIHASHVTFIRLKSRAMSATQICAHRGLERSVRCQRLEFMTRRASAALSVLLRRTPPWIWARRSNELSRRVIIT